MSQVNFFMTDKDEEAFLEFLFSRADTHILSGRFFGSCNPLTLKSKNEVRNSIELTLVNKKLMPEPITGSNGSEGYAFDLFYDPCIEFTRSRKSKKRLVNGRIFAKIGWLKTKEANSEYKKWYGSIERWLKKEYRCVDKIWWFGSDAWEWSMTGGVCCFGGESAFTASLTTINKSLKI